MEVTALSQLRHELRTPLNHVIGYSEMLIEDVADAHPALASALRGLHGDAHRLLGLINNLLASADSDITPERLATELGAAVDALVGVCTAAREAGAAAGDGAREDLEKISAAARHLRDLVMPATTAAAPSAARETDADVATAGASTRGRILAVDDNADNRDVLVRRLTRDGYDVRQASGGNEALEMLGRESFDLVLLDVMMPEMDGYEVLGRIKADAASRDIPVLMISALGELDSVVRCIELGADDYLPKPFNPVFLRARIGASLEKKRLRDLEKRQAAELAEWNRTLEQRVADKVAEIEQLGRLKRFFSPALADAIVAGGADDPLRTHRREITVVFLDLRGFTAFTETAEPEEVMGLLRDYHAAMGELILQHEGTLERFTGDGMMVFFNDPVAVPNPGERAVRMAIEMRARVAALSAGWKRRGHDLALGIGIAQGYATLGAIGFEGRWDYAAIGTVTNLAARLCGEAHGGQIVISARLLGTVEALVDAEPLGELALKGFARPIPAFNVRDLRS